MLIRGIVGSCLENDCRRVVQMLIRGSLLCIAQRRYHLTNCFTASVTNYLALFCSTPNEKLLGKLVKEKVCMYVCMYLQVVLTSYDMALSIETCSLAPIVNGLVQR